MRTADWTEFDVNAASASAGLRLTMVAFFHPPSEPFSAWIAMYWRIVPLAAAIFVPFSPPSDVIAEPLGTTRPNDAPGATGWVTATTLSGTPPAWAKIAGV